MANKCLDVVIVGGSLSGLMHGIILRGLGHNVKILESNTLSAQKNLGAGIAAMDDVHTFMKKFDASKTPYTVTSQKVQFLDKEVRFKREWNVSLKMTSWNCLYYLMRANFDGLKSEICPEPSNPTAFTGTAIHEHGKKVTGLNYIDGLITVTFENLETGGAGTVHADLVIAADGTSSNIRQLVQPTLQRKYVGYVAWRGTAPEIKISEATKKVFENKTTFFVLNPGYVALYTIPGDDGNIAPGHRQLSWIWYTPCPESSQELIEIMTDVDGHRHRNTIPRGKIDPKKWTQQKAFAAEVLPPPFVEMLEKTANPFISAISDLDIGRPSFFDGKLLFVGDALATFRPHVASSTHQAAINALSLESFVRGEINLSQWEHKVLSFAYITTLRSKLWGAYFMHGLVTMTFVLTAVQFGTTMVLLWFQTSVASSISVFKDTPHSVM